MYLYFLIAKCSRENAHISSCIMTFSETQKFRGNIYNLPYDPRWEELIE